MVATVLDRPHQRPDARRVLPEAYIIFAAPALRHLLTTAHPQTARSVPASTLPADHVTAVWVWPLRRTRR